MSEPTRTDTRRIRVPGWLFNLGAVALLLLTLRVVSMLFGD